MRVLNLANNYLRHLPHTVAQLPNLTALWLNDNQKKPLMVLQTDHDERTNSQVLTCFLFPQTGPIFGPVSPAVAAAVLAAAQVKPAQQPIRHTPPPPQTQQQQQQQQQQQKQQQQQPPQQTMGSTSVGANHQSPVTLQLGLTTTSNVVKTNSQQVPSIINESDRYTAELNQYQQQQQPQAQQHQQPLIRQQQQPSTAHHHHPATGNKLLDEDEEAGGDLLQMSNTLIQQETQQQHHHLQQQQQQQQILPNHIVMLNDPDPQIYMRH